MKSIINILVFALIVISCQSQNKPADSNKLIGGPCEGCEAILEYANKKLVSSDTLPAFNTNEPKIKISGTVYELDGKTPASNIIIYIYHTNRCGIYEKIGNEKAWARRHGYIRGWAKTDHTGHYSFYTFRPAAYPDGGEPEHIHMIVKEPNKNEYYIDDITFIDDPLLTPSEKNNLKNRAGNGTVLLKKTNGILSAKRDIVLGLNIPNYY